MKKNTSNSKTVAKMGKMPGIASHLKQLTRRTTCLSGL
jgi:hypothetical protein